MPARATDNYEYRDGEYAIVSDGRSPDGRWSIAAHGDGPYGYEHFGLYLMREPAHEKRAALLEGEHLDTGPLSTIAIWALDSKHVVLLYRSDRHVLDLQLFAVADGKARSIPVPSLADTIGQSYFKPGVHYELFSRFHRVTWQKPDRLALEEFDTFDAAKPIFRAGLEAYLNVERLGTERTFTNFSASAACQITEKGKVRIADIKPQPAWPRTIVYSPHIRYDWGLGLHSTETTESSLRAQKAGQ
jgi:hypothetical protein